MTSHSFQVEVDEADLRAFAELSGDHNPLHTDAAYAAGTPYRRRVLHGAYAAGLVSRMAGMHLPGKDCLLHSLRLKFIAPMIPPLRLRVEGRIEHSTDDGGDVTVQITDAQDGRRYVEASYAFGLHARTEPNHRKAAASHVATDNAAPVTLITGATGALGNALATRLDGAVIAVSQADAIHTHEGRATLIERIGSARVQAAIHCGWSGQDNQRLVNLTNPATALDEAMTQPLAQGIALASVMAEAGAAGATLILVGSTSARRGRHMWRTPMYSLSKSAVPILTEILAMELSTKDMRCLSVIFDTLDGGMSGQMSASAKVANMDRSPWGRLMTMDEAADAIAWTLDNPTRFASGAALDLSGGALP